MGKKSRLKKELREANKGLNLWHYTTSVHIQEIFNSGALKPTAIRVDKGERPALWFSTNPDWERTVSKRLKIDGVEGGITPPLQRDELAKAGITPVRIKVDAGSVRVVDWKRFKQVSGIRIQTAQSLEESAMKEGANPSEWYATFDQVPLDKWTTLDFWIDDHWVSHNLEEYFSMKEQELIQQIEAEHGNRRVE